MPRRTVRRLLLPVAATLVVVSGAAALAVPPNTPPFSTPVDSYAKYDGQTTCTAVPSPGIVALQELVTSAYPQFSKGYLMRGCGVGGVSEHKDGRAWDWPVHVDKPEQKAAADELLAWLTEPDADGTPHARARRLGIMYIIWNGQVFRGYGSTPGWAPYVGSNPHTDHVHFSLSWLGARQATSWGLRTAAPTPGAVLNADGLLLALRSIPGSGALRAWRPATGLSAASSLGGTVVGGLASAVLTDGTLVVAGRGGDDQLWLNRRPSGGAWQGWTPAGGLLSARPDIAPDGAGGADIAVRGADGRAWLTSVDAAGVLGPWTSAGGGVLEGSGPGVARSAPDVLEVVVLGTDGSPWRRTRVGEPSAGDGTTATSGPRWTSWTRMSGKAKGDVALAPSSAGPVIAVRGPDDRVYAQRLRATGEEGWTPLGGALSSSPEVAGVAGGTRADIVVWGTDGGLWRTTSTGTGWSGWSPLS